MKGQKFGMELEMTGLTRNQAARVIARYFHTEHEYVGGTYDAYRIPDNSGRRWKIVSDASIYAEDKNGDDASSKYRVEMVMALRAFFDNASPRELGAAAELSAYEDMRCPHKNGVYMKTMKRCGIKKAFFTSPAAKRATAAAAVLLVALTGVIVLGGSSVGAALERFFSFIPGVGVTETVSGSDIYVLTEAAPSAGDDMITVKIKSADIRGGVLEIHYDIIPLKIDARAAAEIMNAEGIDADVATAARIYREYGYGEYFDILEKGENGRYDLLRPHVSLTLSGEELSVSSSYVCDSEQGSFGTTNCIEKYDISRYYSGETLEALLDVGGVELPFTLTKAEKFTTEKQAYPEGSAVCSAYGTEVVCVPAWTDDLLIVELYGTDCSEYDKIKHMQGGGAGLVFASVNGELIEGTVDGEPPVMYHSDTDTGTRLAFDISGIDGEITSAIICVDNIVAVKHDDFISARISADGSVTERGGQTCEKIPQIESAEINGMLLKVAPFSMLSNPGTFSKIKYSGLLSLRIRASSKNKSPRSSVIPSRLPAVEKGWQGKPPTRRSKSASPPVSIFLIFS